MNAQPNLAPSTSNLQVALARTSPTINVLFYVALVALVGVAILVGYLLPN